MSKIKIIARVAVVAAIGGGIAYAVMQAPKKAYDSGPFDIYGNVELRQISLPFNNTERIAEIYVDAGDNVTKGQVLAKLETGRIEPLLRQAEAQTDAQRQIVARLEAGSRPEEIALAKADLDSTDVAAYDAKKRYDRLQSLSGTSGVSRQDLDSAEAAWKESAAKSEAVRKNYELVLAGPRKEDIAEAKARLASMEANAALLKKQMDDTVLASPTDAVVRTRIMEPGEMASPQKPVFTLAVTTPKWVRTYVGETRLGRMKPGMKVTVSCDSFPDKWIDGTIGFVASVAEFTPKSLQTEELRTALVYEVRVIVDDPGEILRLGMPVTVHIR